MEQNYSYYNWFNKLIATLVDIFFVFVPVATLYVFTSPFTGTARYVLFFVLVIIYALIIYFFKDKIKFLINNILLKIDQLDIKKMLIIIVFLMIALKVLFTILFNYDATQDGDIHIYDEIADMILSTDDYHSTEISHLFAMGIHLAVFKYLHIPIHIGIFVVLLIGTVIYFLSFKNIIGKNKAFLLTIIYIFMPSSVLFSFCPTHEVFVYLYLSIIMLLMQKYIEEENIKKIIIYLVLLTIFTFLISFVNPTGNIIYIIMLLMIVLSNIKRNKKFLLIVVIVLSLLLTKVVEKRLHIIDFITTMNTYTILIHGSNPESLGEQVDEYPYLTMLDELHRRGLERSMENWVLVARVVLLNQYKYLLTHPINLIRLIAHKFYILWSGDHYAIELAHVYNAFNDVVYYVFLIISALLYLIVMSIGVVYRRSKKDYLNVSNYKLVLLGVFAVTLLSVVLNKYGVYMTMILYFLAFERAELED